MKRMMRNLAAVAAVLGAAVAQVRAGALDAQVPADSIVYVGWSGADALSGAYDKSNLKAILDATQIREFVDKQLPKLIEQAAQRDPNAPKIIEKLQQGLGIAWHHPTAFYFCPLDYSNPQMPMLRFGLECDAGADAKALADLLNDAVAQMPPAPPVMPHVVQDGNVVMLTFGKADTLADLKQGGGLAAAPAYQAAMKNAQQDQPAIAVYMDFKKGIATLNEGLAKIPNIPTEAKEKVPLALEAVGVNSLTQAAYVGGFNDKGGWSDHAFVGISGPKKGLLTLLDNGPLSKDALAAVPKEASAVAAWKLDLQKVFNEARDVVGKVDAQAQKDFDAGVAAANTGMGLNLEKDLLAPFGNEWVFYRAPLSDEGGNSPALVVHLKDGPTLAAAVAKLEGLYNNMPGGPPIKIEKVTAAKTEVSTLVILQYSIAWAVKGDNLYVSSVGGIGGAIRQVENKGPSITENEDYKAALAAALPAGAEPVMISYCYPAKLYPELRRSVLGILPVARQLGLDVPMEILPEGAEVSKFMPPGATVSWSAADGMHTAGNSAFPGADMIGGQQIGPGAVTMLAVAGSVALPQMAQGRASAGRSVDMANLRGISQSALVYAADHKDAMPDDLARLVADGMIAPRTLVSRRAGTEPLMMTPDLDKLAKDDFAKFADTVAAHCDYVYLGKDTKSEVNSAIIVAYEKPSPGTPDGLNVAFQDAHVEFVDWERMAAAFEATNANLKKAGRPEVDVKALQQAAGVSAKNLP